MAAPQRETLYSRDILHLAVRLADYPFHDDWPHIGEARSRTCGSTVRLCARLDADRIGSIGMNVAACAVGQAAAAIFASHAKGCSADDLALAEARLALWLAGGGARPSWPEVEKLEPALDYPARHRAILLPWNAALRALSKP